MNSSKHGRASNQQLRPYGIEYIRGVRLLRDSALTLEDAKLQVEARLAKRHSRGETARVSFRGEVVYLHPGQESPKHACPDWDGLFIGPGDPEMEACTCRHSE